MIRSFPMSLPRRRIGTDRNRSLLEVEWLETRTLPASGPNPFGIVVPVAIAPGSAQPSDDQSVEGSASDETATAGVATQFSTLASFLVPGTVLAAGPFQANVTWGDGTPNDQPTPVASGPSGPVLDSYGPIYEAQGVDPSEDYTLNFADTHTFAHAGTYTFTVTFLAGDAGIPLASATGTVTVAAGDTTPPDVTASAPSLTATVGVPVELTGSFTGLNVEIGNGLFGSSESAGDGSTDDTFVGFTWSNSGDQITYQSGYLHTYGAPGTYSYTITFIYNGANVATATGTVVVTASDPSSPVVTASAPSLTATAGMPVDLPASMTGPMSSIGAGQFEEQPTFGDGSTDGTPDGLTWSVGGGQVTYDYTVSHTYASAGVYTYTVAFVVDGTTLATATGSVTVSPATATGQAGDPAPASGVGVATGPALVTPAQAPGSADVAGASSSTAASRASFPTVTISSGSAPASGSGNTIDVVLSELWAGLYTAPGTSSTSSSSLDLQSTSPTDPSQDPLLHWDRGLEILGL